MSKRCITSCAPKAATKSSSERITTLTNINGPPALPGAVSPRRYKSSSVRGAQCHLGSPPDVVFHVLGGLVAPCPRLSDLGNSAVARLPGGGGQSPGRRRHAGRDPGDAAWRRELELLIRRGRGRPRPVSERIDLRQRHPVRVCQHEP